MEASCPVRRIPPWRDPCGEKLKFQFNSQVIEFRREFSRMVGSGRKHRQVGEGQQCEKAVGVKMSK